MKISLRFFIWLLFVGVGWLLPSAFVLGQALTILHNFGDGTVPHDGVGPASALVLSYDGNYYGVTHGGGTQGNGTIFKMTPGGTVSALHNFGDGSALNLNSTKATADGSEPVGIILASDGNFYGTTSAGGSENLGTVFQMTPQGVVTVLHSFGGGTTDGAGPQAGLTQGADGNFYGTTQKGGSAGFGTVVEITPQETVSILHSFGGGTADGASPQAALIQGADGNLYGMTPVGGAANKGCVFEIIPGIGEVILHSFGDGTVSNDGASPQAGLIQGADGNFYGTTQSGGAAIASSGTVFKITPGKVLTILHSFGDGSILNDGSGPAGYLYQANDGNFFGTTQNGGSAGSGTAFEISPQGTVTVLHSFGDGSIPNDGTSPSIGLIQGADANFYGTTQLGGNGGVGTVFKLVLDLTNITSPLSVGGNVGIAFNYQATGTNLPTSFAATNLPDGLSISTLGLITGTPTSVETNAVSLTLTNANGSNTFPLSMTIGAPPPPTASVITPMPYPYSQSSSVSLVKAGITRAFNTGGPTQWVLTGFLPPDLTFDSASGTITGTVLEAGTFPLTITPYNSGVQGTPSFVLLQVEAESIVNQYYVAHQFNNGANGKDGTAPQSILQGFDGNFYGVTQSGGSFGGGSVFLMTFQDVESLFYSFNPASGIYEPASLI